jgi:hypothetical protein
MDEMASTNGDKFQIGNVNDKVGKLDEKSNQ